MYRIEVTARARADADAAFAWIAENVSPEHAERWYRGLFEQIETLKTLPARCSVAAESRKFAEEIRELTYGRRRNAYRILFTIRGKTVVILYIYHASRDELEP